MAKQFYLIQRGKIRDTWKESTSFLSGKSNAIIDPDYMGSAEFEFGAIPRAYIRLRSRFDWYKLHNTVIKTTQGKTLFLLCEDSCYEEVLAELKRFKKDHYHLKEYSCFPEHFEFTKAGKDYQYQRKDHDWHTAHTDFWWCIDPNEFQPIHSSMSHRIGDWIAFVTDNDEVSKKILSIIEDDVKEFNEKSEEEKKELIHKAYHMGF